MRLWASAGEAKYTDVAVIHRGPANTWKTPVPPEDEKNAASPSPLTEVPDSAALRAAANAFGPGWEMETSIVSSLVWLIQRHTVPSSEAARAVTVPAGGENVASNPKFGLKSYMVCASITELQGIDTGVAFSAGLAVSFGVGNPVGTEVSDEPGVGGANVGTRSPLEERHPLSESAATTLTATKALRKARGRINMQLLSPTGAEPSPSNAAERLIAAR